MIYKILGGILIVLGIAGALWCGVIYRFMHMDLTQAEVFVNQWFVILPSIAALIGGYAMLNPESVRK